MKDGFLKNRERFPKKQKNRGLTFKFLRLFPTETEDDQNVDREWPGSSQNKGGFHKKWRIVTMKEEKGQGWPPKMKDSYLKNRKRSPHMKDNHKKNLMITTKERDVTQTEADVDVEIMV